MEKTDLKKIISVSGKPGIYKILATGRSAVIVESLIDGKKVPVPTTQKISTLAEISIFTTEEDVLLKEVLTKMKDYYKGEVSIDGKSDKKVLRDEVKKFLPNYDADRVHDSDLRKLFSWYNILQSKSMLEFVEPEKEEEKKDEKEEIEEKPAEV
jgi:hypothetical protein